MLEQPQATNRMGGGLRAALDIFLSSPEGGAFLGDVARTVLRAAGRGGLSLSAVGLGPAPVAGPALIDEVRSALAAFLLEKEAVMRVVLCPDAPNPEAYLRTAFLRHWMDRARQDGSDPYRRLRDFAIRTLREDGRFHRIRSPRDTLFSLYPENRTIPPPPEEDLEAILFPEALLDDASPDGVRRQAVMRPLMVHFWRAVSEMHGGARVWAPVNGFLKWIGRRVRPPMSVGPAAEDRPADDGTRPDIRYFDPDRVAGFAEAFSHRMGHRLKSSFFLHHCRQVPFRKMAEILGYADMTGRNHVRQTHEILSAFLSELPWLSPPDLNPEAFALFSETLCRILEKRAPGA